MKKAGETAEYPEMRVVVRAARHLRICATFPDRAIEIWIWPFVVARRGSLILIGNHRVSRNLAGCHTRLARGVGGPDVHIRGGGNNMVVK